MEIRLRDVITKDEWQQQPAAGCRAVTMLATFVPHMKVNEQKEGKN